jgi:hypothetical protein
MQLHRLLPVVVSMTLAVAGCDNQPLATPDGASPRYQICSEGGDCGPAPRGDALVGYYTTTSHHQVLTYYGDQVSGEESWKGTSYSEIYSTKIARATVNAVSYTFAECQTSARTLSETVSSTVYGIGRAQVWTRYNYRLGQKVGYQVIGTHTFVAAPGYAGGGTYTSESSQCDNYV